jgi:hypothetical protein
MCLPWQQWIETSVWFDDVGMSAFHSCVVVDLWQSLSEWGLVLTECFDVSELELEQLPVREFLASKQITVVEHPPYSPDLAPNKLRGFSPLANYTD